jgi:hypothetical protein
MTTLTLDFVVVVGEEEAGAVCVSGLFSEEAEAEGVATTESSVSMLYKGLPTVIYTHTHTHTHTHTRARVNTIHMINSSGSGSVSDCTSSDSPHSNSNRVPL